MFAHGELRSFTRAAEPIRHGRLERLLRDHEASGPPISAVFSTSQRQNVKIRAFADFSAELLQRLRKELDTGRGFD